jgi:hypothetical protein
MQDPERLTLSGSVDWPIGADYLHVVLRLASQAASRVGARLTTRDFEREVVAHTGATHVAIRRFSRDFSHAWGFVRGATLWARRNSD